MSRIGDISVIDEGEYFEQAAFFCDPTGLGELAGYVPDLSFIENPVQFYGAIQNVPLDDIAFELDVPADVDASIDANFGVEQITWSVVDAAGPSDPAYTCVVATGDDPVFLGGSGTQGTWHHTMDDTLADVEGRSVREQAQPGMTPIVDQCFDNIVALGLQADLAARGCTRVEGLTGWTTALDSANTTLVIDYTGYDDICVAAYRDLGATPCTVQVVQPMRMQCTFPQAEKWHMYVAHQVIQMIPTVGAVSHSKNSGATWYFSP